MKILVAEDDRVTSKLLVTSFRKLGWDATPAYDAMQTVMFAKREPQPDVILLDLNMPGGTGRTALERLQASSLTSHIPVVVVTAETGDEAREDVLESGATEFVQKPVDPSELADIVSRILGLEERA